MEKSEEDKRRSDIAKSLGKNLLKFRKENASQMVNHPFKMPFAPYTNYFAILMLLVTLVFMVFNPDTRVPLFIGLGFLVIMSIVFFATRKSHRRNSEVSSSKTL